MSIDYRMFLRDKPQLEQLAADDDEEIRWWANELAPGPDETWRFGGMTLTVSPYPPLGRDEIATHPARSEIHWIVDANGRLGDLFDAWEALVEAICTRWRGGCYSSPLDELVWFTEQDRPPIRDAAPPPPPPRHAKSERKPRDDDFEIAEPLTRELLAALIDRAPSEEPVMQWLKRRPSNHRDKQVFGKHFIPLLIERARAGASAEPWRWTFQTNKYKVPELDDDTARDQFASLGSFARQIVDAWDGHRTLKRLAAERKQRKAAEAAARAHQYDDLVERRRRGGELHAGVPADILALARTDRARAIAEYARRYELSPERARAVIDANVA